jgi:hypothetical protein
MKRKKKMRERERKGSSAQPKMHGEQNKAKGRVKERW